MSDPKPGEWRAFVYKDWTAQIGEINEVESEFIDFDDYGELLRSELKLGPPIDPLDFLKPKPRTCLECRHLKDDYFDFVEGYPEITATWCGKGKWPHGDAWEKSISENMRRAPTCDQFQPLNPPDTTTVEGVE